MTDPRSRANLDSQTVIDDQALQARVRYVAPSLHRLDGTQTEVKTVLATETTSSGS